MNVSKSTHHKQDGDHQISQPCGKKLSDEEVFKKFQKGDRRGINEIVNRYYKYVLRHAIQKTKDPEL